VAIRAIFFFVLLSQFFFSFSSWFFGFIDPAEAGNILLKSRPGAFLFRFSSTPRFYTLSANNRHRVGHWRIAPEGKMFLIDERKYTSLQNIIEIHVVEPLKGNQLKEKKMENEK
jgi:hypothetical protein